MELSQILSFILSAVGICGFLLAGQKIWWAWYVNLANQLVWLAYSLITQQWGFLLATAFYMGVFSVNAYKWTKGYKMAKAQVAKEEADVKAGIINPGSIGNIMQKGGTEAQLSNALAQVVIDVYRAKFGEDSMPPLSVRYGIAHVIQRRFDVKVKPDYEDPFRKDV